MHYITFPDPNGDGDEELEIAARYEVCDRCRGEGKHVNPAIDGNGITQSEALDLDEDFWESYRDGAYDVTCEECRGKRVVLVVDEDSADRATLALYRGHQRDEIEYRHMCAMERRYGA